MMNHKLAILSIVMLATLVLMACTPVVASDTLRAGESATVLNVVPGEIESVSSAELDNDASVQQAVSLFTVEPIVAGCCGPLATPEDAVDIALEISGVSTAALLDDASLLVHFDPIQTDDMAIASAINQAAFLVTIEEFDSTALAAAEQKE